jgi:hypothetical protein
VEKAIKIIRETEKTADRLVQDLEKIVIKLNNLEQALEASIGQKQFLKEKFDGNPLTKNV